MMSIEILLVEGFIEKSEKINLPFSLKLLFVFSLLNQR